MRIDDGRKVSGTTVRIRIRIRYLLALMADPLHRAHCIPVRSAADYDQSSIFVLIERIL